MSRKRAVPGRGRAGPWPSRPVDALAVGALAGLLSFCAVACGAAAHPVTLALSVPSGPPGTVVHLKGNAGQGCGKGKNWEGFVFERYGRPTTGPVRTMMVAPVEPDGAWLADFVVPPYLARGGTGGAGAPVAPGRYEFVEPACKGHTSATALFSVTAPPVAANAKGYVGIAATPDGQGYWLVQADGRVDAYGDAAFYGSLHASKARPAGPIVAVARTYDGRGYWLAGADGQVYTFGDAGAYGSLPAGRPAQSAPITSIATTPDGKGYWLVGADGRVYGFGDARAAGAPDGRLAPYDAIAARPAGGYVVTAASNAALYVFPGGTLSLGGAGYPLSATMVGTAVTPSGNGAWQVGADGGVITWGDAGYYGSLPGESVVPAAPITAIAGNPDGHGYWLLGANGNVFSFGSSHFYGFGVKPKRA